jgi:hypothetical protein
VKLTPKGRKRFNTMAGEHEGWIVKAFAGLNSNDIHALHGLLGRAKQGLSRPAPQGSPAMKPPGNPQNNPQGTRP